METKPDLKYLNAIAKSDGKIITVGLALAFAILALDLVAPLGIAAGIPYVVIVVLCLWAEHPATNYLIAVVGSVFTVVGYFLSPEGGVEWIVLTNRGLAIFAIWAVALISARKLDETIRRKIAEKSHLVAEKELHNRETRYRSIINTTNEGFWRIDKESRIIEVNDAICKMLGYQSEEILGKTPFDFADRAVTRELKEIIEIDLRQQNQSRTWEGQFVRKDGTALYAHVSATNYFDSSGDQGGRFAFLTDLTEQRKRDDQLQQAQKMEALGQLTGGVAHEFNNLLMVILGNIETLESRLGKDDPLRSFTTSSMKGALRGAELTQSLLAFSRKQRLRVGLVDFNGLVLGMQNLFQRTLGETITVKTDLAKGLWRTSADAGQIEGALLNFVLNARDAMPDGGTITMRTLNTKIDADTASRHGIEPGDYVTLEVGDTGMGMTGEQIERAFEPFYTTKEVGSGTGLGLSVAFGFSRQSGGCLEIESEPGKGTTVRLCLPRDAATDVDAEHEQDGSTEAVTGSGKILVLEDDAEVCQLVCNHLSELGYRIVYAEDGLAALTLLKEHPDIDLLFTDVVLPGELSGPKIARKALEAYPDLKILFTSGYPDTVVENLKMDGEEVALLRKPYLKLELAEAIAAVLDPD